MKRLSIIMFALILVVITACAGRKPQLVEKETDQDNKFDCAMLKVEVDKCETCIIDKYHDGKTATSNTVGAAVVGYVIFPPALLFMDLKKADYKEMGAYMERRKHLVELGKDKNCVWYKTEESDDELMAIAEKKHKIRRDKEIEENWGEKKDEPEESIIK